MYSPKHCRCSCWNTLIHSLALVLVFALHPLIILAEGVDRATAESVARNFYLAVSATQGEAIRKDASTAIELELVHQEFRDPGQYPPDSRKSVTYPLYYVFNVLTDRGFVIVSGSEQTKPILGYARKGAFRESQQSPEFKAWMESYKIQIISALEDNLDADPKILEEWKVLTEGNESDEREPRVQPQYCMVPPLVSTKWDQGYPYNACCPVDSTCPNNRACAGCAAVAMAQLMHYWEHPAICHGLEGYWDQENTDINWQFIIPGSDYGWIEVEAPLPYDWSIMPDELNESTGWHEIKEVSRLVFQCGVSVHVNYGPDGSPADGADIPSALSEHFNYSSSMQYLRRQNFSTGAWKNLLKVELDMGRPVLYMGQGDKGGHAFVCDGYEQNGYFHFNWGWGGANDNYFCLDELVPGSTSLVEAQRAIIGICPEFSAADPCENIIPIKAEGILHAQSFQGANEGWWSNYLCGWSTPGREQIYSFVAPSTGLYSLVVTSIDGYVDCAWKGKECRPDGWNCIGDICTAGIYSPMSWKEGETYYILVDDEDTTAGKFEFYIEPQTSTGAEKNNEVHHLNLFLHPDSHFITIEAAQPCIFSVDVCSVNGRILYSAGKMEIPGQLDVSFLPQGIYFLTLRTSESIISKKIIKF